jgi:hypothetical protein
MNKLKKGAHDVNCLCDPIEGHASLMKTYGTLEGDDLSLSLSGEVGGLHLFCIL